MAIDFLGQVVFLLDDIPYARPIYFPLPFYINLNKDLTVVIFYLPYISRTFAVYYILYCIVMM
jgi:hypothetical protein